MNRLLDSKGLFLMDVIICRSFFKRLMGLMMSARLEEGKGILIEPCERIHTFFMRYPIWVIYLSEEDIVLDIEYIRPWKLGKKIKGTVKVVEFCEGRVPKIGEQVKMEDTNE